MLDKLINNIFHSLPSKLISFRNDEVLEEIFEEMINANTANFYDICIDEENNLNFENPFKVSIKVNVTPGMLDFVYDSGLVLKIDLEMVLKKLLKLQHKVDYDIVELEDLDSFDSIYEFVKEIITGNPSEKKQAHDYETGVNVSKVLREVGKTDLKEFLKEHKDFIENALKWVLVIEKSYAIDKSIKLKNFKDEEKDLFYFLLSNIINKELSNEKFFATSLERKKYISLFNNTLFQWARLYIYNVYNVLDDAQKKEFINYLHQYKYYSLPDYKIEETCFRVKNEGDYLIEHYVGAMGESAYYYFRLLISNEHLIPRIKPEVIHASVIDKAMKEIPFICHREIADGFERFEAGNYYTCKLCIVNDIDACIISEHVEKNMKVLMAEQKVILKDYIRNNFEQDFEREVNYK